MKYETDVVREVVTGYLLLKSKNSEIAFHIPLVKSVDPFDDFYVDVTETEVLGSIPAAPGTFRVSGWCNDQYFEDIGYQFNGIPDPNWKQILIEEYEKRCGEGSDE